MSVDLNHDDVDEMWGTGAIRIFISHTKQHKALAGQLGEALTHYGMASFVAHSAIPPMQEWLNEIRRALFSMDLLIALMTEDFHDSEWTDQEVGAAIGRQCPIVPVKVGRNPYGFMKHIQAVPGINSQKVAYHVLEHCLSLPRLQQQAVDAYIAALIKVKSFAEADVLIGMLPSINTMSEKQCDSFVEAYNNNDQVHRSREYNTEIDIVGQLERIGHTEYTSRNGMLRQFVNPFWNGEPPF